MPQCILLRRKVMEFAMSFLSKMNEVRSLKQGWANYGPRALTEIQTLTVNQAQDFFLLFTDFL